MEEVDNSDSDDDDNQLGVHPGERGRGRHKRVEVKANEAKPQKGMSHLHKQTAVGVLDAPVFSSPVFKGFQKGIVVASENLISG